MKQIILFVVACTLLTPLAAADFDDIFGSAPSADDALSLSGQVTAFTDLWLDGADTIIEPASLLKLKLGWEGFSAASQLELVLDTSQPLDWEHLIDSFSVSAYLKNWRLEAGLLKKEWGSGDGTHVVDLLNAPDYSHGIKDDLLAMKRAEPMFYATGTWGNFSLDLAYKPVFMPLKAAALDSRWDMVSPTQQQMMSGLTIEEPDTASLSTWDNGRIALRARGAIGPADLGLIYSYGRMYQGAYDLGTIFSDATIRVNYTRAHFFGAEATAVVDPLTFMAESGFHLSEDIDGTDAGLPNSRVVWLAGAGATFGSTYASLTWQGQQIMNFDEDNPLDTDTIAANQSSDGKSLMNTIVAALELPLFRDRLTIRLAGSWQVETLSYALLPSVMYELTDDFEIRAAARIFGTFDEDKPSLFATWDNNDTIQLSARYWF